MNNSNLWKVVSVHSIISLILFIPAYFLCIFTIAQILGSFLSERELIYLYYYVQIATTVAAAFLAIFASTRFINNRFFIDDTWVLAICSSVIAIIVKFYFFKSTWEYIDVFPNEFFINVVVFSLCMLIFSRLLLKKTLQA